MFTVIPAIDILKGQCVRLTKGDYALSTVYSSNPIDIARSFEKAGAKRIHIVDLDGAKAGKPMNMGVIKEMAKHTSCELEVGGGIRTIGTIKEYLEAGIRYAILGSIIFKDQTILKEAARSFKEHIIAGVDLEHGQVKVSGWLEDTKTDAVSVLQQLSDLGITTAIITDIAKDGMLQGPSLPLYSKLSQALDIHIIASGGVTTIQDIHALSKIPHVTGCIVGKAIYEGTIELREALDITAKT